MSRLSKSFQKSPQETDSSPSISAEASAGGRQSSVRSLLSSAICFLFSILLLLAAFWSAQVMSSAWICSRGGLYQERGDLDSAEGMYKTAVLIDSQNWAAFRGLGRIYAHRRYYELDAGIKEELALQERDAFSAAKRINPKKVDITYGLAVAEKNIGNRARAMDLFREAAHYKRFNDFYWRKLGIELRKAGLYAEAKDAFEHAYHLNRSNKTVRYNLNWLKERLANDETGSQPD